MQGFSLEVLQDLEGKTSLGDVFTKTAHLQYGVAPFLDPILKIYS